MKLLDRIDILFERGADRLEMLARDLGREDGFKRQLAEELHEDAQFLRKLTPTKIAARARGETPPATAAQAPAATTARAPAATAVAERELAPAPPPAPAPPKRDVGGPNPLVIVGAAFVAGIVLAKIIDWRGHAHPKR
jgi:hypothetical protein